MHAGRERLDAQRGVVGQQNGVCLPRPDAADGSTRHYLVHIWSAHREKHVRSEIATLAMHRCAYLVVVLVGEGGELRALGEWLDVHGLGRRLVQ